MAIEIKNLTKTYNGIKAVDNLSLNIKKGLVTGLIGADGAGKTTLIRLIAGLLLPDSGSISVFGLNPQLQKEQLTSNIGYMPQKFGLYEDLTVIENLKLYAALKGVNLKGANYEFDKLLDFTNLAPFQNRLAGKLSGGMKQKLGVACALLKSPSLLLLDEPSVGVDPISRKNLMKMVKEMITPNTTVLWSTAYLDEAHSFDIAVLLDKGKVVFEGNPHTLAKTQIEFENKVIKLMGGYKKEISKIAQNYNLVSDFMGYSVQACDLEKKYGDFWAVKNNSFCIQKGEIFGLLGPNGAGKSTSFKMMCGLSKPTSGTALIMGIDITKEPQKARFNLGYMAQKFSLYGSLTVRQNLEFFASVYGISILNRKKRIDEIIETFDFQDIQHLKSEDLPLGFKQRLSMACALIHNPSILFLDEPTSGVDVIARRNFWNHITSLAKKGVTILVTTHFMDEAEYCDRISLFYKGQTVAIGTPSQLKQKANADNMEDAFITLIKESEN